MVKVKNMFNIRKFAICGLLVAAVLVNTSSGYPYKIQTFENFIKLIVKDANADPDNYDKFSSFRKNQIDLLRDVEDDFQRACVDKFNTAECPSENYAPHYASCMLAEQFELYVENIKNTLEMAHHLTGNQINWQFDSMMKKANIIHFFVHKKKVIEDGTEMETEKERLKKIYPDMQDDEAKLWFILHKYDEGILGDLYPEEKPENTASTSVATNTGSSYSGNRPNNVESTSVTPETGAYVSIQNRFQDFIASVKGVDRKRLSPAYYKYEIDLLDKVGNDFKIQCLIKFEERLARRSEQLVENELNYGYESLHQACFNYFIRMESMITSKHKNEIVCFIQNMLEGGTFIQFLVNKANEHINDEAKTVMRKLREKYPDISDEEAKLRVVIHNNYNGKKFGTYYPSTSTPTPSCLPKFLRKKSVH